jgi:hypothetical protein
MPEPRPLPTWARWVIIGTAVTAAAVAVVWVIDKMSAPTKPTKRKAKPNPAKLKPKPKKRRKRGPRSQRK